MWLDKIESFQKDNSQILDMKHELHLAIYIKGLLKESIEFSLVEGSLLIKLIEENKELSFDEFYYWWNIHRFDEVITEEELIFNPYNPNNVEVTRHDIETILKKYGLPPRITNFELW